MTSYVLNGLHANKLVPRRLWESFTFYCEREDTLTKLCSLFLFERSDVHAGRPEMADGTEGLMERIFERPRNCASIRPRLRSVSCPILLCTGSFLTTTWNMAITVFECWAVDILHALLSMLTRKSLTAIDAADRRIPTKMFNVPYRPFIKLCNHHVEY